MFITRWPNFKPEEFMCKCGSCDAESGLLMNAETMDKLQLLRSESNFSFQITSGYRCANHPDEKKKKTPGAHGHGQGIDIFIRGKKAFHLTCNAEKFGFTGIGISQKGSHRFIHLDDMSNTALRPRPWVWSY